MSLVVPFKLNTPQAKALLVMANETWCPWGRGAGKTSGVIAPWLLHKVEKMPRSSGGLVGTSFVDIEEKILKLIFTALGMFGYEEDSHYCYGKEPPRFWKRPYIPVINWDHVLSFPNGTTMELISLHKRGSANGLSLQWLIGDEAKLLNEQQLRSEVFPILRGNTAHFGTSPWYGAKLFVTDKYSPTIRWILDKKKLMDEEAVQAVIYYQLKVNELRIKKQEVAESTGRDIQTDIYKLERLLGQLRKNLVYYIEASAMDNIENLMPSYFDNMQRSMTKYEYGIAIDNKDPLRAENNFYANRTEEHLFDQGMCEDVLAPIGVALDYQASVTPLVAFQLNDMLMPGVRSLNFLDSIYVLDPLGLRHVVENFCNARRNRPCKVVYYFYDHTAVGKRNMHKKLYEEVMQYFQENGWQVHPVYMGAAPSQHDKHRRIRFFLEKGDPYPIRIHTHKCASMLLSMDLTAIKETEGETKKDKTSEKDPNFPQEQSTHFSDAFDMAVWGVLERGLYPVHEPMSSGIVMR